jgi:general secretion pathway protein K
MFQRLFELLGIPAAQVLVVAENLRAASDGGDSTAGSPAPLLPQQLEHLVWLGVSPEAVAALRPYIVVLPGRTPVNLNTASAEVIASAVNGLNLADAQRLVAERASAHLRNLGDAGRLLPAHAQALTEGTVGVSSRFFEVHGRLRLDDVVVEERSLLFRDGTLVTTLQRERGVAGSGPGPHAPAMR